MTNCVSALKIATDTHTEDAKRIVTDSDIKLPEGCPSRASLAK